MLLRTKIKMYIRGEDLKMYLSCFINALYINKFCFGKRVVTDVYIKNRQTSSSCYYLLYHTECLSVSRSSYILSM